MLVAQWMSIEGVFIAGFVLGVVCLWACQGLLVVFQYLVNLIWHKHQVRKLTDEQVPRQ